MAGTGCGVAAGLVAALGVVVGSFWLFCFAALLGGAYMAVIATFRFAAADCCPPDRRARALAVVLGGGLFAGVLGPQLVTYTMDLWAPYLFAVTYLAQAAFAGVAGMVLFGVRLPAPTRTEGGAGRPLGVIARQPRLISAVAVAVASYFVMNWLMTSTPLAMRLCGLSQSDANLGIQWHILAMYGPSFVTGRIISRVGAARVVAAGLVILACAAMVGQSGITVWHFWASLTLLGLGWNFGFVGASAMILDCYQPEERTRVQSVNDFAVFGSMVVGSFVSGGLLNTYGWETVCWLSLPPLVLAALALWATSARRLWPA